MMDKSEVKLWLQNDVTVWFFAELEVLHKDRLNNWQHVFEPVELRQLQGRQQVFDDIKQILELSNSD